MATCAITTTFRDSTGAAIPNARVTFVADAPDKLRGQDGAVLFPQPVEVTADGAGVASFSLKTGDYTYSATSRAGAIRGRLTVPDRVSATLDSLLLTPDVPHEVMTWPAFQALVDATPAPYASVSAGLAAVAEGVAFIAASDDTLVAVRKVGGAVTFIYPELM